MRTEFLEACLLHELDIPEDDFRLERVQLTLAACLLMSAKADLSPEDAVGDVIQVYQYVSKALKGKGQEV